MLTSLSAVAGRNDAHLFGIGEARPAPFIFEQDRGLGKGMIAPIHGHRVCEYDTLAFLDLEITTFAHVLAHGIAKAAALDAPDREIHLQPGASKPGRLLLANAPGRPGMGPAIGVETLKREVAMVL